MESTEKKINILHLSDLHFGLEPKSSEKDAPVFEKVCSSFLSKIDIILRKQDLKVDFIVVTGDIANSAETNEYNNAFLFFDALQKKFGESKILFIPGNHDKMRDPKYPVIELYNQLELLKDILKKGNSKEIEKANKTIQDIANQLSKASTKRSKAKCDTLNQQLVEIKKDVDSLDLMDKYYDETFKELIEKSSLTGMNDVRDTYNKKLETVLDSANNMDTFSKDNFSTYSEFIKRFYKQIKPNFRSLSIDEKALKNRIIGIVRFDESNLVFVLLNTAWLCQNSKIDPGRLTLGEKIIDSIEKKLSEIEGINKKLVVTLMHHCPNSFRRNDVLDRGLTASNLAKISNFSNIILSGHEHSSHFEIPDFIDNKAQLLTSGTFYTGKKEPYSCVHYQINQEDKSILIHNVKMDSTLNTRKSYDWFVENDPLLLPFANPEELMIRNKELKNENERLTWLYEKSKKF